MDRPDPRRRAAADVEREELADDETLPVAASGVADWLRQTPYWAISAVLHLFVVGLLLAIAVETGTEETDDAEVTVKLRPPERQRPFEPLRKRRTERQIEIPKPELDLTPCFAPPEPQKPPSGNPDAASRLDLDQPFSDFVIGPHGGPGDRFGPRNIGPPSGSTDGSQATEDAVLAALHWLRRHQNPDGSWSARDFTQRCVKTCTNVHAERYGDGRGFAEHDVGVTALAMLAFTGAGHTHRHGAYSDFVEVLRKACRYMRSIQVASADPTLNGRYGSGAHEQWIYDHAIATLAMAELLVMSGDTINLTRSVEEATRLCLRAQNDGFGWRYGVRPGDNDTSVTGWMVLALKAARYARLRNIPEAEFERAFAGALAWIDRATSAGGKTGYSVPGDEGSRLAKVYPEPYPYSKELSCMTAVGVLCRLFAGERRSSAAVRQGIDVLMRSPPAWLEQKGRSLSTVNLYYWYYGSYALFHFDGPAWEAWNEAMQAALLPTQRQGNIDEDGSWDPIGEWGIAGGRVYATAIGALTLQVYKRYARAQEGVGI